MQRLVVVLFTGAGSSYEVEGSSDSAAGMCCGLQEVCIPLMYGVSHWQCLCRAGRMVMPLWRVALLHPTGAELEQGFSVCCDRS